MRHGKRLHATHWKRRSRPTGDEAEPATLSGDAALDSTTSSRATEPPRYRAVAASSPSAPAPGPSPAELDAAAASVRPQGMGLSGRLQELPHAVTRPLETPAPPAEASPARRFARWCDGGAVDRLVLPRVPPRSLAPHSNSTSLPLPGRAAVATSCGAGSESLAKV